MNNKENQTKWIRKIQQTLELGNRSKKTFENYKSHIIRFLKCFDESTNLKKLKEADIFEYININYINKNLSGETYNMAIKSIKYFYEICFEKSLNSKLLPNVKNRKRLPNIIEKQTFINIFNHEKSIKHKCWLLLAFFRDLELMKLLILELKTFFLMSTN